MDPMQAASPVPVVNGAPRKAEHIQLSDRNYRVLLLCERRQPQL
jgi:hypothetical protein